MKKFAVWLLAGAVGLSLAGCVQHVPDAAADGSDWNESWVTVGGIVGVETPEGLTNLENRSPVSSNELHYATWSIGDAEPFVNEDGKDMEIYDAQMFLVLAGFRKTAEAKETAAEWLELASERYNIETTAAETYNGQEFTVITYTYSSETNPYARGASAYGVYRNYAINAELSCREEFDGDAQTVLADFLENCHYAA